MALKWVPFALRLPPVLHAALKKLAEREHRSLNAQILTLLLEALAARKQNNP